MPLQPRRAGAWSLDTLPAGSSDGRATILIPLGPAYLQQCGRDCAAAGAVAAAGSRRATAAAAAVPLPVQRRPVHAPRPHRARRLRPRALPGICQPLSSISLHCTCRATPTFHPLLSATYSLHTCRCDCSAHDPCGPAARIVQVTGAGMCRSCGQRRLRSAGRRRAWRSRSRTCPPACTTVTPWWTPSRRSRCWSPFRARHPCAR